MGIAIGPIQATDPATDQRYLILAYIPRDDGFLGMNAQGQFVSLDRLQVVADWRYDPESGVWQSPDEPAEPDDDELEERHEIAVRALFAISEFDHPISCPNRADFSVWECNCTTFKPDAMARMALETLENLNEDLRDEQAPEEVPVSPLPTTDSE
jgi:hypothetical protein